MWCRFGTFASVLGTLLVEASLSYAAPPTVISTCGETVSGVAELQADLDCSTYGSTAITMERGTLRLNGFTITGNIANTDPNNPELGLPTVLCERRCKVIGPGVITNSGGGLFTGGWSEGEEALKGWRRLQVENVTIEGNGGNGVGAAYLILDGSTVRNNAGSGVVNHQNARVLDSVIENNGLRGIVGTNASGKLRVAGTTVGANQAQGIVNLSPIRLRDSTVTGNAIDDVACAYGSTTPDEHPCVDLLTDRKPRAQGLVCDTSYQRTIDGPSGVCALD
jgi:hypothetical protein